MPLCLLSHLTGPAAVILLWDRNVTPGPRAPSSQGDTKLAVVARFCKAASQEAEAVGRRVQTSQPGQ